MDPQLLFSILVGKSAKQLIKLKGGGATAAPGLYSLYIDKNALSKLSEGLERTILVSGTNGKTTTTRLIGNFLEKEHISYTHNRHGSNLERGLVSTLLQNSSFGGTLKSKTALFEVDEAALGNVTPKLRPSVIVLTNLFRDQLDRYGEIDNIKRLWERAFSNLSSDTTLVLNADDPSLAYLGQNTSCRAVYFGINDPLVELAEAPKVIDSDICPKCQAKLEYKHFYSSHQGDYSCPNCKFKRPELDIEAKSIEILEKSTSFQIKDGESEEVVLKANLAGIYNIYNCLAAYATIRALKLSLEKFPTVLNEFSSVFGRGERFEVDKKHVLIALAKNPTGFNEIIRTFLKKGNQTILVAINDKIADGRDVSWLWDVDFETLAGKDNTFLVSGIRGTDMGLRLKYTGIQDFQIFDSIPEALESGLKQTKETETLVVVPTYTAMLEIKKILAKKNISGEFWED